MIRPTKKKRLNKAGLKHVAGWVLDDDTVKVDALVAKAKPEYDKIMGDK